MASLREVKDRISSVKSTLKITSAMKLVASSKLRKAQRTIEALRPYETALADVLAHVPAARIETRDSEAYPSRVVVVAISSNQSLCGGFNANVIKKALATVKDAGPDVEVWPLGRKMAEAMRKAGYPSPADYTDMIAHPSYSSVSSLANTLIERYVNGEIARVILVYSHFVSTSRQEAVAETYLPFEMIPAEGSSDAVSMETDYIIEPSAEDVARRMLPQVLNLKLYAAVLDSAASEHAARTLAMQTASDNAKDLIADLTLEYNKGRQQKITAEILDLVGGAQQ